MKYMRRGVARAPMGGGRGGGAIAAVVRGWGLWRGEG
jgi:hypothetical protein